MTDISDARWLKWIDNLAANDYVVIDDFVSDDLYKRIMTFLQERRQEDDFRKAGIGAMQDFTIRKSIRGDFIYWIDDENCKELSDYFSLVKQLIGKLNRYCYLGLTGYEFHLAVYPSGTFYKRHLDQFKDRKNRTISMIVYLNKDWQPGDGGELRIFNDNDVLDIAPLAKRCVLFKSDLLEHEVLETKTDRYSITGWLLKHPAAIGHIVE